MSEISIRAEAPGDEAAIRAVNLAAFDGPAEADIVDRLRAAGAARLSLVAKLRGEPDGEPGGEARGNLVGHILFSEVRVGGGDPDAADTATGLGLAPMAVLPAHQRRGIGSALVRRGLERLAADGCPFVVVLGHPGYYPRFGFTPASGHGITSEYEGVPDEAFLLIELTPGGLGGVTGVARYRPEFAGDT